MRTTITIDEELLAEAKALAARQHRTVSDVVADALRAVLAGPTDGPPVRVELPVFGGTDGVALVDLLDRNALAEALGDNEWPRRTG